MNVAFRGLLLGGGYGLAVAIVEATMMAYQIVQIGIPQPALLALRAGSLEVLLGVLLGLVFSPLLRVRAGWLWHLLSLGTFWVGSGLLTLQGDFFLPIILIPALGGLVLACVGLAVARRSRVLAGSIGLCLWIAGLLAVELVVSVGTDTTPGVAAGPAPDGAPDIVLVVLDTVRAANVSAYGYARPTTPAFDALAAEGALFVDATAPATWSLPSHASLFTGRFASSHGAHAENRFLEHTSPQLAEVLAEAGYETACFTANPWISDALGLTRGIQIDDEAWRAGGGGMMRVVSAPFRILDLLGFGLQDKGGGVVSERFVRWLGARPDDAPPLFVFLNFVEAHFPYHIVPNEYMAEFTAAPKSELRDLSLLLTSNQFAGDPIDVEAAIEPATDMYDAGVLYSDSLLRQIVEALRSKGSLDETIVVVLSDHGELIGEHGGFGHGRSLLEPVTRVPLAIRYPARISEGTRVETPVSTVGVYATILDLVGLEVPPGLHVGSLVPAMRGGPPGGPVLAEVFGRDRPDAAESSPLVSRQVRWRSYRAGSLKLIESSTGDTYLFDLENDPGEIQDLAAANPVALARLRAELDTWLLALAMPPLDATVAASELRELDPAARERLRALGYLE